MAKFSGKVGFVAETEQTKPGVWEKRVVERNYYGDILRTAKRNLESEKVNEDINLNNSVSIVADAFAQENFSAIAFVDWSGACWRVSSVTVQRPRLILELGAVYNGSRASQV